MKYKQVIENEWEQPIRKNYKMSCCDCGLVHNIDFRIVRGKIQIRGRRNNRATGQVRRHKKNEKLVDISL